MSQISAEPQTGTGVRSGEGWAGIDAPVFSSLRTPAGPVPPDAPAWNQQRASAMPSHRYRPVEQRVDVPLLNREWPDRRFTRAPLWVPVDLRDGNQALADPMDSARKWQLFSLLVTMGFKEIEVGYPSASQTDFDFVRFLAQSGTLPDDVTIVAFTAARQDLIERTFEAVRGLPRVVVHLYTATAPVWRDVVLGRSRRQVHDLILDAAGQLARGAEGHRDGQVRFQFSPEVFNLTEPDYILEICNSLTLLWDADPARPVTHNLPATVEIATPNIYADQIEYMDRHLELRDSVILSIHPHNDRGTGVACAELAVLAGAQRVEGCLFGNGERTGNVDLVTLALNLHAQGVDPMIDFSDIDVIRDTVQNCNRLPVHPRHPYGGELAYTAFSGTHQDAISKGLLHHARRATENDVPAGQAEWAVPYLPIDPADVGRSYEAVIRVNSQSGKGGIAHVLKTHHGMELPDRMRADFSQVVQAHTDGSGTEITPKELWELFRATYLDPAVHGPVGLASWTTDRPSTGLHRFGCELLVRGETRQYQGTGNGPISAFAAALAQAGIVVDILRYAEHSTTLGNTSPATAYVECQVNGQNRWGAAQDTSILTASVQAVMAAINRAG